MTDQGEGVTITADEVVAPVLYRTAFHCPYCGVYAPQEWVDFQQQDDDGFFRRSGLVSGDCFNCHKRTLWVENGARSENGEFHAAVLLWPKDATTAPRPHADMPDDVRGDYEEARGIVERSPRGAAALLRLGVQKLMVDLGQGGKNINEDIKALVAQGLPVEVQQALDAMRVIGNNAVHPGELDLKDDTDTAISLFSLLNYIVEQRIAQPKKLQALYGKLPANAVAAIQQRDGSAQPGS